jgi:hypothetical protein
VHRIGRNRLDIKSTVIDAQKQSITVHQAVTLETSLAAPVRVPASDLRLAATLRMPSYSAAMFEKKGGGFVVYRKYPRHPDQTPGDLHPLVLSKVIGARAELLDQGAKRWIFELGAKGKPTP